MLLSACCVVITVLLHQHVKQNLPHLSVDMLAPYFLVFHIISKYILSKALQDELLSKEDIFLGLSQIIPRFPKDLGTWIFSVHSGLARLRKWLVTVNDWFLQTR